MALYICSNSSCQRQFDDKDLDFIRCSYCNSRVLFKQTPPTVHKVSTN